MVINQDCCRSCRSIIPEGVLFGIQKISVSLFVCFTCKLVEVTIMAKTGDEDQNHSLQESSHIPHKEKWQTWDGWASNTFNHVETHNKALINYKQQDIRDNKWEKANPHIANLASVKNFGCFNRLSKRCSFKYSAAREPPWPVWNFKNLFACYHNCMRSEHILIYWDQRTIFLRHNLVENLTIKYSK